MASRLPSIWHQLDTAPERLVGLGFRCAMTCLRPGSNCTALQSCALLNASIKAHRLPAKLNAEFTAWALAVDATAERPIELSALEHPSFSSDESLAIALVAACQHAHCPALTACASALLGSHDLGRALAATQILAHTLFTANAVLHPRDSTELDPYAHFPSNPKLSVH
ncbi:MAG: hypothetical protein ABL901_21110 [Hyphomicrobiaceae bacterium]